MCKVIAIANQEGRSSQNNDNHQSGSRTDKEWGKKVVLVDADPQGHLTMGMGFPKKSQSDFKEYDGKYHHGTGV